MEINAVFNIAKKEIMDNIRNKWVIIISFLFTLLTLLVSYAGSLFSKGWQDLSLTVLGMSSLVQYIISIIALILGYAAIIGETEKGSMSSLLTLPVTRLEIVIGKFLGLGVVLTSTILIGFGFAGIVIGLNVPNPNYVEYLVFIAASILMGLVFLSIGLLISCFFKKRSTAMGGAIFIWIFFSILWMFISAGLFVATTDISNPREISIPDWYYGFQLINPTSSYSGIVALNIGSINSIEGVSYPSFYTTEVMIIIQLIWLIVPLALAYILFRRSDI